MEAKPFASLSSGLLARKGAARPAMRPQGFGQVGSSLEDLGWNDMGFEPPKPAALEVTDDGSAEPVVHPRAHPTGLTPVQSPVHDQQAELVERLNGVDEPEADEMDETAKLSEPAAEERDEAEDNAVRPVVATPPAARRVRRTRAVPGSKGKAAFTLRLDPDRHLKLRLACAVDGRSAQQLVTDALDQLLGRMPEVDGLAAKAKRRG